MALSWLQRLLKKSGPLPRSAKWRPLTVPLEDRTVPSFLPAVPFEAFLSRPAWIGVFLDALEQGKIKRGDIDPARIQALQAQLAGPLRARAARLFAANGLARRQDVVSAYQPTLRLKGDRVGSQVGADLNAIGDQAADAILLNILDPNREVKPQFLSYFLVTDAGRILTGIITEETANSITIRRADGTSETVLRIHIGELRSTGLSFMPEGLEKQVDVPAMADLLAYLKSSK
jgi:putative heme-binding domain-containing protein